MTCLGFDRAHEPSSDPRRNGCVRCGRAIPADEACDHTMDRDLAFEERILRECAGKLGLEHVADALHAFADRRALNGPVRLDRDLVVEASEEVADLSSYLTWELQRMQRDGDDDHDRMAALWSGLQYAVLAYDALLKAR